MFHAKTLAISTAGSYHTGVENVFKVRSVQHEESIFQYLQVHCGGSLYSVRLYVVLTSSTCISSPRSLNSLLSPLKEGEAGILRLNESYKYATAFAFILCFFLQ